MKLSHLHKLLGIGMLISLSLSLTAQKLPVGVSFKRLFLDYQTLNGGDFGAFQDYRDGFEFGFHAPLSKHFMVNIPVKIGLSNKTEELVNTSIIGLDLQMHYFPLSNPKIFSPYLLAGAGGVYQGMDSFNVQTPVGIGLDIKIAKNAYFNVQSEYRWSNAENNSNFNHGIGFKYFFGRKEIDTVVVIPVLDIPDMDTDMDGIFDKEDICPTVAGLAVFRGCPDSDGDGVEDSRDDCPVIAGLLEFNGCPDSDGDGTEDSKDKCPKTYGPISNAGCPVIEAADREVLTFAMKAVQFQLGKATLVTESYGVLNQIVGIMNKYPDYKLSIDGHTDNTGTAEVNRKLSENRAKACYDYLASKGIPTNRLSYQGFGPTKPIADNSTYSGRTLNRRVEFNLTPGL